MAEGQAARSSTARSSATTFPVLLDAFWLDVKIFLWSRAVHPRAGAADRGRPQRPAARRCSRCSLFAPSTPTCSAASRSSCSIYLIGFGVPGLGLERPWNSPLIWGSVALMLSYSAYVSEVFRAGIESVHESQRAAARSLGMSSRQTMRSIVLPQAVRRVVPPLMNDFVSLQKDVALVSLIGPVEILRQAGIDKAQVRQLHAVRRRRR